MTALVIADATNGTGRFNLAQGLIGTASGIGASLSTALFGLIAVTFGQTIAFLCIASVAVVAALIIWFWMPETRPLPGLALQHHPS
jgi:sugar phosphate permease